MDNETIRQLKEAVELSPENVPLRLHLAEVMLKAQQFAEAAHEFGEVLTRSYGNLKARLGLAEAYFHQKKYSAALIIYEEIQDSLPVPAMVLYVKCLLKENSRAQAVEMYQKVIALHPEFRDEEIDQLLRMSGSANVSEEEEEDYNGEGGDSDSRYFLQKPKEKFSDVGGMKRIKEEISIKIIQPLKNPDLFKAFGKKTGGGILLYGPPGCGKTYIAKATAGEIDAKFISIGLHDILDMWIGNSEKNLHAIFELARKNAPCVLFFDEVDAMGASRNDMKQSAMRHVINQFLSEMDGVNSSNEGVLILAATNAPWSVDPAFRRPGRFDRVIFVEPPDEKAREEILAGMLQNKPVADIDVRKIAKETNDYSGADLQAVIDIAVEDKLRESLSSGVLQPIGTRDLLKGVKAHRPTTLEWFASARNYALYANESGLYDDILKFLKIKK
ncbi:MAG: AAA family ATPase [Pseudobacter sp.]|uniref:AAA family ATPase n=1 Tax=Pseudobacter sp. TaxID=2045420 RepID=UPI003F81157E